MTELERLIEARKLAAADNNEAAVKALDDRMYKLQGGTPTPYYERLLAAANLAHKEGNIKALESIQNKLADEAKKEQAKGKEAVVAGMGPLEGGLAAFGESARHAMRQAANIVPGGPSTEQVKEESANLAPLFQRFPKLAALGAGTIAVPPAVAVGSALPVAGAAGILSQVGLGVGQGAVFSEPGRRTENAITGGTVAGALPLTWRALRGAVQPSGAGKTLTDMGYGDKLTIGQATPGSFINQIEQAGEKVPVLGRAIRARRSEGSSIVADRMAQEMAPPGTSGVLPSGAGMQPWLKEGLDRLSTVYDDIAKSATGTVTASSQYPDLLASASTSAVTGITPVATRRAQSIIKNLTKPITQSSTFGDVQQIRSDLREMINKYRVGADKSGNPDYAGIVDALQNSELSLTQRMKSVLTPDNASKLDMTDKAYSRAMLARDALVKQAGLSNPETISPGAIAPLLQKTLGRTKTATGGGGPFRDFIEAAQESMAPLQSTEGSQALSAARMGPLTFYQLGLDTLGAITAASGAYSKTGQALLKGTTRPQRWAVRLLESDPDAKRAIQAATIEMLRERED